MSVPCLTFSLRSFPLQLLPAPANTLLLTCSDYIARLPLRTEESGRLGGGGGGGGRSHSDAKEAFVTHGAALCDAIYSRKYNQVSSALSLYLVFLLAT